MRALPIWKKPVGLGAKRTRTLDMTGWVSEQKVPLFTVDFHLYVVVHVVGSVTITVESHVLRVGALSID